MPALVAGSPNRPTLGPRADHRAAPHGGAAAVLLLAALGWAPSAWAYLDPGTGSMILSAIVGLVATVTLAVKTWWYRLRRWFRRADAEDGPAAAPAPEDEPSSGADA